ncbi:MAG TPA: 4-(cytidine 5'-diphospho)-2-C-methyl-D-erythritol kinase [Syntrophorhabdaceae bacterium]|nr:4-(cytidine 5'-diphospho)-2-C-methyl-D-erythritol kinase [Syntrophorhabdaceae bacterium]
MKKTVLSPAKVNLYLKVISKRPDGYHNIQSVVDIVSVYDTIHIEDIEGDGIVIGDDRGVLPQGEANTVFRAVRALREAASVRRGVRVFIEKRIPIGSGLGGPSTNAATVLKELRDHWELSLGDEELRRIGAGIGADVPLFLYGRSCVMEGTGDIISPVSLPKMWYVIVYPNVAISTKTVYEGLKIVLTNKENDIKLRGNFKNTCDIASILENDLERVGMTMCPQIGEIKTKLKEAKALGSLMSGSGSSVFGIFANEEDAWQASSIINNLGVVFVAYSL